MPSQTRWEEARCSSATSALSQAARRGTSTPPSRSAATQKASELAVGAR